MATQSSSSSGGIGLSGLLGVLFVGLRLTGYIDWPWVWVLAPFWVPFALLGTVLVVAGFAWAVMTVIEGASKR